MDIDNKKTKDFNDILIDDIMRKLKTIDFKLSSMNRNITKINEKISKQEKTRTW